MKTFLLSLAILLIAWPATSQNGHFLSFKLGVVNDRFNQMSETDILKLARNPSVLDRYNLDGKIIENGINTGANLGVELLSSILGNYLGRPFKNTFLTIGLDLNLSRESIIAYESYDRNSGTHEAITLCDMQNEVAFRLGLLQRVGLGESFFMEFGLAGDAGMNVIGGFMVITDKFSAGNYSNYSRSVMQTGDISSETDKYRSNKGYYTHISVPIGFFMGDEVGAMGLEARIGRGNYNLPNGDQFEIGLSYAWLLTIRAALGPETTLRKVF